MRFATSFIPECAKSGRRETSAPGAAPGQDESTDHRDGHRRDVDRQLPVTVDVQAVPQAEEDRCDHRAPAETGPADTDATKERSVEEREQHPAERQLLREARRGQLEGMILESRHLSGNEKPEESRLHDDEGDEDTQHIPPGFRSKGSGEPEIVSGPPARSNEQGCRHQPGRQLEELPCPVVRTRQPGEPGEGLRKIGRRGEDRDEECCRGHVTTRGRARQRRQAEQETDQPQRDRGHPRIMPPVSGARQSPPIRCRSAGWTTPRVS